MRIVLCGLLVLGGAGCATAKNGALMQANDAFSRGDCAKVLKHATYVESSSTATEHDKLETTYLRAGCADLKGDTAGATGLYEYLVKAAPDSDYGMLAAAKLRSRSDARTP